MPTLEDLKLLEGYRNATADPDRAPTTTSPDFSSVLPQGQTFAPRQPAPQLDLIGREPDFSSIINTDPQRPGLTDEQRLLIHFGRLPQPDNVRSVASVRQIKAIATAQADLSVNVAGDLAIAPIPYGRVRIGARILFVGTISDDLVVVYGWCLAGRAGVEAIEKIYVNGVDQTTPGTGITWTHYTGQPGAANYEDVDATVVSADASWTSTGVFTHADTLNKIGYAYTVGRFTPAAEISGFPEAEAIIQGLRLYDPREAGHVLATPTTWEYTGGIGTCPALALGDIMRSEEYGLGFTVDDTALDALADVNDALVSGSPRHTIGLALTENGTSESWLEALRTYASCYIHIEGDTAYLIPDRARTTDRTLTTDDISERLTITPNKGRSSPSHVRVWYTDTAAEPWRQDYAEAENTSATNFAVSDVQLPGIQNHEEANRAAVERLNHLSLDKHTLTIRTDDKGLRDAPGDVLAISHNIGSLSGYLARVQNVRMVEPGVWEQDATTYSASVYSDANVAGTTPPVPGLPDPYTPVQVTGLGIGQAPATDADGITRLRTRIQFTAAAWAFAEAYQVTFKVTAESEFLLDIVTPHVPSQSYSIITPQIEGGQSYRCEVTTIGPYNNSSAAFVQTFLASLAVTPDDPTGASATQISNDVSISWSAPSDPNVVGYAVRRGTTSQTVSNWASMTVVTDLVDAEIFLDTDPPISSTTRYFVRSISHTGGLSSGATTSDIDIVERRDVNLLYTGDFPSWQEGATFFPFTTVGYCADLWECWRGSNAGDMDVSRQAARTNGLGSYSMRVQRKLNNTSTQALVVTYAFEEVEAVGFRGKHVTVDFWVQTGANFTSSNGLRISLRDTSSGEASYLDMSSPTTQSLRCDGTDTTAISSGSNSWTRVTAAFPNPVGTSADGVAIAIYSIPTGTAGANDWFDITEVQIFIGKYYSSLDGNSYKVPPDFVPPPASIVKARIERYLKYSDDTLDTAAFMQHSMRALPTRTAAGAPPWKFDARL